jgi:hypothetical protein
MLKLLTFRHRAASSVLKPGLLLPSNKVLDVSKLFPDTSAVIAGTHSLTHSLTHSTPYTHTHIYTQHIYTLSHTYIIYTFILTHSLTHSLRTYLRTYIHLTHSLAYIQTWYMCCTVLCCAVQEGQRLQASCNNSSRDLIATT